jgi:hypothetical protein
MSGPDSWAPGRRPGGIPVLPVADVRKAAAYYRRFFGFAEVTHRELAGRSTLLRGHGVVLELRLETAGRGPAGVPGAVLLVERPERMRRELDDLGAHLVTAAELGPGWERFFGFRDCYGNVIAAGQAGGIGPAARRMLGEPADAAELAVRERRRGRAEQRHLAEFRAFYEGLSDQRDIYYMLVTGGLLHWVRKALSLVPSSVNLVLLGSDLPADDLHWLREQAGRPFHHVRLRLDEAAGWEFLFAVNRGNFGWIDPGCFVLDARIFGELSQVGPATALNCAWSWDSGLGFPVASTQLVFVNAAAIAAEPVRRSGTSPGMYSYQRMNRQVEGRRCYTRTPSRAQRQLLSRLLPASASGRPAVPRELPFFDTMVMYQLVARACGFGVARVRNLESLGHIRGAEVEDESSDELFYIGALSYADVLEEFSGYFHDPGVRLLYLIAEYVVLAGTAAGLPQRYPDRLQQVTAELSRRGLPAADVPATARDHLMRVRGMSAPAADGVLRGLP